MANKYFVRNNFVQHTLYEVIRFAQGVKGVVVVADAEHLCMRMRGVRNDATLTSFASRGIYENKEEKESIMAMIRKQTSNSTFQNLKN